MRQKLIIRDDIIVDLPNGPVGISFSGGVESTLIGYLVLSQLKTFPTYFFTLSMLKRNFVQHYRTSIVLAELSKQTKNYNIFHHITCGNDDDDTTGKNMFNTPKDFVLNYNIVNSILAGGNANPPDEIVKSSRFFVGGKSPLDEDRNPNITRRIKCNAYLYAPFTNLNKQDIIQIYKDNNIDKTILPLTQSCWTHPPCGDCWHCFERNWGEEVLD